MADTSKAASDAGEAAKEQALASSWPPSKADYEAIGGAAGAAAGTALGGPVGGAIGAFVGAYVGGLVYELGDYLIGDAGYNPASGYLVKLRETNNWRAQVAQDLAKECGTTIEDEQKALERWGANLASNARDRVAQVGADQAYQEIANYQKSIFAAAAARISECQTLHAKPSKNSVGAIVVLGVASAIGIGILQKIISRGKF